MIKKEPLISVNEALGLVLKEVIDFGVDEVVFKDFLGRVLRENILADREVPPFDRVSMDGIAIKTSVFTSGARHFKVENIQAAGSAQLNLQNENHCIEAMTGAILPKGTDAVIPFELIDIENGTATINSKEVRFFQNIHKKGLDRSKNEVLIPINTKISSAEIGVLATVG